jgi:hypothetical protein
MEEHGDDDGRGMDVAVAREMHVVVTRGGPGDDTVKVYIYIYIYIYIYTYIHTYIHTYTYTRCGIYASLGCP